MRVGFDLDGVVYNWHASLRQQVMATTGRPASDFPDPTRWHFWEDWGLTLDEFIDHCNEGVNKGIIFEYGKPYLGVRGAMLQIKEAGHTIHIVTDRRAGDSGRAQYATTRFLDLNGLPYDSLTFAHDKTVVRLDTMIDDKVENYDELEASGVAVYLMDQAWNQHTDRERIRVYSVQEYANIITRTATELANA